MKVTILDTQTGKTVTCENRDLYYWQDGDGSCDCNRALAFSQMIFNEQQNSMGLLDGICLGTTRFLITNPVTGMNSDYPSSLLDSMNVQD
jgi:hypothetical protein